MPLYNTLVSNVLCMYHCSGVATRSKFLEFEEHVHRKVMEVDFFAPWILTHDVIKGCHVVYLTCYQNCFSVRRNGRGRIWTHCEHFFNCWQIWKSWLYHLFLSKVCYFWSHGLFAIRGMYVLAYIMCNRANKRSELCNR